MNAHRTKAKNKHACSRSGLLLPSEVTFRSFSQSVVKRKLKISKADDIVKGLLAELLIFRIRFSILQTLQTCKLTTRTETGSLVGTHIVFYPSTSGSPPTPSDAPPRSREGKEAFIVFWVRSRRSRAQPSGLEETLNKVEVGVWSDFACLVAFLEISDFCSKSTKTQRGYPLRFGHWPITKIINYLFI